MEERPPLDYEVPTEPESQRVERGRVWLRRSLGMGCMAGAVLVSEFRLPFGPLLVLVGLAFLIFGGEMPEEKEARSGRKSGGWGKGRE